MPRCITCGTVPLGESPMMESFFCTECEKLWCGTCGDSEVRCPACAGSRVVSFTLTEDAFL